MGKSHISQKLSPLVWMRKDQLSGEILITTRERTFEHLMDERGDPRMANGRSRTGGRTRERAVTKEAILHCSGLSNQL